MICRRQPGIGEDRAHHCGVALPDAERDGPEHDRGLDRDDSGDRAGELNLLRGQIATAKANYAQMESTLGPNHPQAKALKAQIDELTKEIDTEQKRLLLQAKQNYIVARDE